MSEMLTLDIVILEATPTLPPTVTATTQVPECEEWTFLETRYYWCEKEKYFDFFRDKCLEKCLGLTTTTSTIASTTESTTTTSTTPPITITSTVTATTEAKEFEGICSCNATILRGSQYFICEYSIGASFRGTTFTQDPDLCNYFCMPIPTKGQHEEVEFYACVRNYSITHKNLTICQAQCNQTETGEEATSIATFTSTTPTSTSVETTTTSESTSTKTTPTPPSTVTGTTQGSTTTPLTIASTTESTTTTYTVPPTTTTGTVTAAKDKCSAYFLVETVCDF
ncbi:unnamed protein product [Cylicocyclus nassatus]|uniref:Uncharacterized protein n=1 Tax=Cylicocyclus nassatus TaxID=53992 RepID=A0AA36GMP2_CYLNA|nr:unnamed protein product [Cylicocyclus nassatus]